MTAPLQLSMKRIFGTECANGLPTLGGCGQYRGLTGAEIGAEISRTPQRAAPFITTALLGAIANIVGLLAVERESGRGSLDQQAKDGKLFAGSDLKLVIANRKHVLVRLGSADGVIVLAEVNGGPEP